MSPAVPPVASASSFEDLIREITHQVEQDLAFPPAPTCDVFRSAEAELLKREIVGVGRKLWERHYVDGAGGNISVRIGEQYVLCTPRC